MQVFSSNHEDVHSIRHFLRNTQKKFGIIQIKYRRRTAVHKKEKELMMVSGNLTLAVFSGSNIPAAVLDGGVIFSIKTRFSRGIKRLAILLLQERLKSIRKGHNRLQGLAQMLIGFKKRIKFQI